MNPERNIDWSILRGSLMILFISVVLSSSILAGTWYFRDEMEKKYNIDRKRFQTISNQYLAVDNEEKLIKQYFPEFIELYNQGLIGQERRLNWVETLRYSSQAIQLPALRYEIESQIPYTPDYPMSTGIYRLFTSPMKLTIDLLHMGDLDKLFTELDKNALGYYSISTCKFNRKAFPGEPLELKPNISAECELQWINLKRSDGSAITL